jgi:hypothetical protein
LTRFEWSDHDGQRAVLQNGRLNITGRAQVWTDADHVMVGIDAQELQSLIDAMTALRDQVSRDMGVRRGEVRPLRTIDGPTESRNIF